MDSSSSSTSQSPDFQWIRCAELGYADGPDSNDDMAPPICFECHSERGRPPIHTTTASSETSLIHTRNDDDNNDKDVDIPLFYCSKCRVAGT